MSVSSGRRPSLPVLAIALLFGAALLRMLRLSWQPLWWDEGYSIYFATEPLARMAWLTARDIHPPLYYALLHLWIDLAGASPESTRALSVLFGVLSVGAIFWLARVLYPGTPRIAWIATALLAVNPWHLYYSQEVRMYGLAMALGMAATAFLWRMVSTRGDVAGGWGDFAGFVLSGAALLYTLYYGALLLFAQAIWLLWTRRQRLSTQGRVYVAWGLLLLLYLPWLLYSIPLLLDYVAQKVASDQDLPLGFAAYLFRHFRTVWVGHVTPADARVQWGYFLALAGLVAILAGILVRQWHGRAEQSPSPAPAGLIATVLAVPFLAAFLLNLRLPFFPDGGERLLLFLLPYLLLLVAAVAVRAGVAGTVGCVALLLASLAGVWTYYTTPRYQADDYRPIIEEIAVSSSPGDHLLALFPWMIGYWRAYAPPGVQTIRPVLLGDGALEYGPEVESTVDGVLSDAALADGKMWFPLPLGLGSRLPEQIESWLQEHAINAGNRWFGENARLTAWSPPADLSWQGQQVDFGPLRLVGSALPSPAQVSASNAVLATGLAWQFDPGVEDLAVSLRLVDEQGRAWASRAYAPPGQFASIENGPVVTESVGMIVPAGAPPGDYTLALAVASTGDAKPLPATSGTYTNALVAPLATVRIEPPTAPPSLDSIRMASSARSPVSDGLTWLGANLPSEAVPAGTDATIELLGSSLVQTPPLRELYVNLVGANGETLAGWEGWPLRWYPTTAWPQDLPVRVPVSLHVPPSTESGAYQIEGGWINPQSGARTPPVDFGSILVRARPFASATPPPQVALDAEVQFGTHARLLGYSLRRSGDALDLELTWEVLQTLLPPHHIFVHADDALGATVAQGDGEPLTALGPAPTGSWRPGERIVTQHTLDDGAGAETLRVGLYDPESLVRLPVSIGGVAAGDSFPIDMSK